VPRVAEYSGWQWKVGQKAKSKKQKERIKKESKIQ
jgi:hypothetical protein